MYWLRLQALDVDILGWGQLVDPTKTGFYETSLRRLCANHEEIFIGSCTEKKCFPCTPPPKKNYKGIPASGLGGGLEIALSTVTPGPRSLQLSADREAEPGVRKSPRCLGPSV